MQLVFFTAPVDWASFLVNQIISIGSFNLFNIEEKKLFHENVL